MNLGVEEETVLSVIPDTVLLKVFAILPLRDRCVSQRTARRWQILLQDASLWQTINMSKDKRLRRRLTNRAFASLLRKYGHSVKSINVKRCVRLTDVSLLAIASFCPDLERLNVNGCIHMTHHGLMKVAVKCARIQAISLFMTGATEQTCNAFLVRGMLKNIEFPDSIRSRSLVHELISRCDRLRGLSVHGVMPFADENEARLTNCDLTSLATRFPLIEKLRFDWCCGITDTGLRMLADTCAQLKKIHLRECQGISTEGIAAIILRCQSLEELVLQHLFFKPTHFTGAISTGLPNLKKLKIVDVAFTEKDLTRILALPVRLECAILEETSFLRKEVSDNALKTLTENCKDLKKLRIDTRLETKRVLNHISEMKQLKYLFVCCPEKSGHFDQEALLASCPCLQNVEYRYQKEIWEMQDRSSWSVHKQSHVIFEDKE